MMQEWKTPQICTTIVQIWIHLTYTLIKYLDLLLRTIMDLSLTFQPIWVKTFLGKMRICGAKGLDVRDESVTVHTGRGRQATE